jgi:hypothetical protein
VADLRACYAIDPKRIYAVGPSNGTESFPIVGANPAARYGLFRLDISVLDSLANRSNIQSVPVYVPEPSP